MRATIQLITVIQASLKLLDVKVEVKSMSQCLGSRVEGCFRLGTACPKAQRQEHGAIKELKEVPIWPKLRALGEKLERQGWTQLECRPHEGVLCLSLGGGKLWNAVRIGEI